MPRTRIKICGITRVEDAKAAAWHGADAIGLVFYPPSPRNLTVAQARAIAMAVPPFVSVVALFVNESPAVIRRVLETVPVSLLQFHGEESEADCLACERPYLKVARMRPSLDLLEYARLFPSAQGVVLDSFVEGYGGAGECFDWSLIPRGLEKAVVLSGGLKISNVTEAVRTVAPWGVDVSSGVESAKGIKDAEKIERFIAGVRHGES